MQMECKTSNVGVRDVKYPVDIGQGLKIFLNIHTLYCLRLKVHHIFLAACLGIFTIFGCNTLELK